METTLPICQESVQFNSTDEIINYSIVISLFTEHILSPASPHYETILKADDWIYCSLILHVCHETNILTTPLSLSIMSMWNVAFGSLYYSTESLHSSLDVSLISHLVLLEPRLWGEYLDIPVDTRLFLFYNVLSSSFRC